MPGLSFDVLRVGKRYSLTNFDERYEFIVEKILPDGDFTVKDLHTLEHFRLKETIQFGMGKDFEIQDLEDV